MALVSLQDEKAELIKALEYEREKRIHKPYDVDTVSPRDAFEATLKGVLKVNAELREQVRSLRTELDRTRAMFDEDCNRWMNMLQAVDPPMNGTGPQPGW